MNVLLIDCHALCYRAYYTTGQLAHGDRATGIPYGFFTTMLDLSERYRSNRFVFCWDSKGSKRKGLFPQYKENRNKLTPEEQEERRAMHRQFDVLRDDLLPACGFRDVVMADGYEADDLIAAYALQNDKADDWSPMVAVSGDADLLQLLRFRGFRLHNPTSGREWTATRFQQEYGITAREWVAVKCIAGCPGDGVPGIRGVAEKSAIKYLKGELKGAKLAAVEAGMKIIRRNRPLVELPFRGCRVPRLELHDGFTLEKMRTVFQDLGFDSFLSEKTWARWEAFARIGMPF